MKLSSQKEKTIISFRQRFQQEVDIQNTLLRRSEFYNYLFQIALEKKSLSKDSLVISYRKYLANHGMGLYTTEGHFFIDQHPDFFFKLVEKSKSKSLIAFFKLRQEELKEGLFESNRNNLTFQTLAKRISLWEEFLRKYSSSLFIPEVEESRVIYLSALLFGMEGLGVFTLDQKILSDVIKSLTWFKNSFPKSPSTPIILEYLNLLNQHEMMYGEYLFDFFEKHKLQILTQYNFLPEQPIQN